MILVRTILLGALLSCAQGHVNIPDSEDLNRTPQRLEEREEESFNRPDSDDGNSVPGIHERRAKEEERNYFNDPPLFGE